MEFTWLSRWQPQLLSILRIVVALLYLEHGTAKLLHFPIPQPGVPDPLPTILVAAAIIELVVGTLLVLGLFTRLAAFIASGEMAAGYFISHFPRGFWPVQNMSNLTSPSEFFGPDCWTYLPSSNANPFAASQPEPFVATSLAAIVSGTRHFGFATRREKGAWSCGVCLSGSPATTLRRSMCCPSRE